MPQIKCPYCGTTINLKNRRREDFQLILRSVGTKERSFSELLKITKLPRKTLYLRLRQLLSENKITKNEKGLYCVNNGKDMFKGVFHGEINRPVLFLLILCISVPAIGLSFALMMQSSVYETTSSPEITPIGYFDVKIVVKEALNVYGWQAVIEFDPQKVRFVDVISGDFLGDTDEVDCDKIDVHGYVLGSFSMLCYHVDVDEGVLVIAQTLLGSQEGRSGDGVLAHVRFAYYTEDYEHSYRLALDNPYFKTCLLTKELIPTEGRMYLY